MTFRSRSQLVIGIAIAVIGGGVGMGSIFSARGPVFAVMWALEGVFCVFVGIRLASARIRTDSEGFQVVNIFKRFHLDWAEVRNFEMGRWTAFPSVCLIQLSDGQRVHAFGLQESTNFPNGSAQRMVDELNDELDRRRAQTTSGTDSSAGSAQRHLFS